MLTCPECHSPNLIKFGTRWAKDQSTGQRKKFPQYQCKDCGRITTHPEEK